MSAICPGQDTRYWRPTDIFEIECAACGASVEFFKDDVHRRCHGCGALVQNPKITLGCAQWCEHAKQCLGYDPKELAGEVADEGSLLDRLIAVVRRELSSEDEVARALDITDEVEALLSGGASADRKRVLASALLGAVSDDRDALRALARDVGLDDGAASDVVDLVLGAARDSGEGRLLDDARRLVELRAALRDGSTLPNLDDFATSAGRERARKLASAGAAG